MDISDSARLFAAVDMSLADAVVVSWDSKLHFGFWRPVTAIQLANDDGNPETDAVPDWEPLIITPPYPEYTSGLTTNIGALSRTLSRLLGDGRVDLNITSVASGLPDRRSPDTMSSPVASTVTWSTRGFGPASTSVPQTLLGVRWASRWVTGRSIITFSPRTRYRPVAETD